MVLRYQLGSGAFTPANTQMQLLGRPPTGLPAVDPAWEWECTYGQVCQSGAATLSGGAALATNHNGYVSPAGFIAGYSNPGDDASWQVLGAPAGAATVTIRYSNYIGAIGGPAPRTMTLVVNGTATQVTLPPTSSWDDWSTVTEPVTLQAGHEHRRGRLRDRGRLQRERRRHQRHRPRRDRRPGAARRAARRLPPVVRQRQRHLHVDAVVQRHASPNTTCDANIPSMAQGLLDTLRAGTCSTTPRPRCGRPAAGSRRARRATCRTATCSATARTTPPRCDDLAALTGPGAAAARVRVRQLVLPVLPVHDRRLREPAAARVQGQRRVAGHAVGRHRLEDARTSGTAGSGTPRCSPTRRRSWPGPSRRASTSR